MRNIGELGIGVKVDTNDLNKATKEVQTSFKKTGDSVESEISNGVNKGVSKAKSSLNSLGNSFKDLGSLFAGIFAINKTKEVSDSFISMQNALKQVSSGTELDTLQGKILALANNARVPVEELTKGFVRFDLINKQLGGTQDETLKIMESLSKGLSLSGASAEETSSSILQLSQAFGSGVLQGDEFRSLAENMPMLMTILAKSMGVPRGELKQLASDGMITSKILKDALIEANGQINSSFAETQTTISQKLVQIKNDFLIQFGEIDKNLGFTDKIVYGLDIIRNAFLSFTTTFPQLTLAIGGITASIVALTAASVILGPGIRVLTGLFAFLTPTIATATGQVGLFRLALGFLTGPIGLVITALTVVAGGVYAYRKELGLATGETDTLSTSQKALKNTTDNYQKSIDDVKKKQEDLNKKFNDGTISSEDYKKATEDNKQALDDLTVSQGEVQKGLDIIDDKQLTYKQKVEEINKLSLNDTEYQKLIGVLRIMQGEAVKTIQLQQLVLKSKIAGIQKPETTLASKIDTTVGKLTSNKYVNTILNKIPGASTISFLWDKSNTAMKKGAVENAKNLTQYQNDLKQLQDTQKTLADAGREAEAIIKKPVISAPSGGSNKKTGGKRKKTEAQKQEEEQAKQSIDNIKKEYDSYQKKLKDVGDAQSKLKDDTKKYNTEIEDSIRDINTQIKNSTKEYEKQINTLKSGLETDLASRGVTVAKDLLDTEQQIADLKSQSALDEESKKTQIFDLQNKINLLQTKIFENTAKTNESTKQAQKITLDKYNKQLQTLQNEGISIENQTKLTELEAQRTSLMKEQEIVIANTTEAQRAEATRKSGLTEAEKLQETAQARIDAKTAEFEAEKKKQESLLNINKVFLGMKKLNEDEFNKYIQSERFLARSQEEQDLILKLGREKIELTNQRDSIIGMQTDIANATIQLSNDATAIQMANITALKTEYASLIQSINNAIIAQNKLASSKKGFAVGGYTGDGPANEVAGNVHKGEWVAPKWMVNSMKPLFDNLEQARGGGVSGGVMNTTNKTQNNNITVNNGVDLKGFIDYAKWKM